jgi:PAS domain S-box-containing protein
VPISPSQQRLLDASQKPLSQWSTQLLAATLLLSAVLVVYYTYRASEQMVLQYATDSAQEHAESVTQFRNFYAQELVPRAVRAGVQVTHDYKQRDNALPLPATLTIELGHYLSQVDGGTQVRLYSDMPFPWRQGERHLDDFQQQALQHLKQNPETPFVREDWINGQRVLRYAQADRMLSGCVSCHNQYPGSPKTTWKEGDVRGALEVTLPVTQWQSATTQLLNRAFVVLLMVLLGGILMVWLSVRRIRSALETAHELSAQRQAAIQELRLSESKLNSIFESVPEAIVVADSKGQIVQCNLATTEVFGFQPAELIGQNVNVLMPQKDRTAHDEHLQIYQETGRKKLINNPRVVQGMRKDGTTFPVRVTINETRLDDAHFFVGVMQDHTAALRAQSLLIEARDKAEQANRLRGEFLANMSHEIRTPMNGILGMTEMAMAATDAQAQKEYLTLARDSASHLLHIINQILDFSKIEAGALELEKVAISPAQLVRHTARSLEQLAHAKGLTMDVHNEPTMPELLWLDPVRMRQVLTNLIGNAIKFTDQGRVTVAARCLHSSDKQTVLEISVADTGIGFDQAKASAIFSPFMQADGSITRSYGGTGLGLAITRSLVQLMGGEVIATSEQGKGATFTIHIPVEVASQAKLISNVVTQGEHNATPKPPSLKVLLVEDHAINRKLAEIMLQRMGHQFVLAEDGQQALDCLHKETFDVVLMDVMMPVMDGLTALKKWRIHELQNQLARTPVLMVTAHAMTGDRERFLEAGADGYVSKPMTQDALRKEIERVCHLTP